MKFSNKRRSVLFMIVLLASVLGSCVSEKSVTFFRDFDAGVDARDVQQADDEYRIKPNDNLYVSVKTINPEVNEMFTTGDGGGMGSSNIYGSPAGQHILGYQVDNNGDITLPIMGAVNVGGRTLKEAKEQIQIRSNEYLKDADIQIRLLNFKVSVLGEVRNPGLFYNYNNTLTVLEAVGMAGGTTEFANLNDVIVVRQNEDKVHPYKLDLTSKDILYSEAFYLNPNDVIVIRPQQLKNFRLNASFYTVGLSALSTILLIINFFR